MHAEVNVQQQGGYKEVCSTRVFMDLLDINIGIAIIPQQRWALHWGQTMCFTVDITLVVAPKIKDG